MRGLVIVAGLLALMTWLISTVSPTKEKFQPKCAGIPPIALGGVLVCSKGMKVEELRREGQYLCRGRSGCNAWIWYDASKAPDYAPTIDHPWTEKNINSAIAVWKNNQGILAPAQ